MTHLGPVQKVFLPLTLDDIIRTSADTTYISTVHTWNEMLWTPRILSQQKTDKKQIIGCRRCLGSGSERPPKRANRWLQWLVGIPPSWSHLNHFRSHTFAKMPVGSWNFKKKSQPWRHEKPTRNAQGPRLCCENETCALWV